MNILFSPQGIDVEEITNSASRHPSMLIGLYFYFKLNFAACPSGLTNGRKRRKPIVT